MSVANLQLYSGGTARGLTGSFARNAVAFENGSETSVAVNTERYDKKVPQLPLPTVTTVTTDAANNSELYSGHKDSAGTFVSVHRLVSAGGVHADLYFTHGSTQGTAQAAAPDVSDGRRYNYSITDTPAAGDLYAGIASNDEHEVGDVFFWEDAVVAAAQVTDTDSDVGSGNTRTGMAIAVGNYTAADGLSGNGGDGTQLDIIYCDLLADDKFEDRVKNWCIQGFVLRNANELWVTVVDYINKGAGVQGGVAVLIKATRSAKGSPWTFGTPTVVFDMVEDATGADHMHNFGVALTSSANTSETAGTLVGIATYGDTAGQNGAVMRYVVDPDDHADVATTYTYDGETMNIAFAMTPNSRWSSLPGWSSTSGSQGWSASRILTGQMQGAGDTYDWSSAQWVGCCPGKTKSQILMGGDVCTTYAVACWDVDDWDLDSDQIYPKPHQRWGGPSMFGADGSANFGHNAFNIECDDPWNPTYWVTSVSPNNFTNSADIPDAIMLGMADPDDDEIRFSTAYRKNGVGGLAVRDDATIYCGFGAGSLSQDAIGISFASSPVMRAPRQLGAGHVNYKAYYNWDEAGAGTDQANNSSIPQFEITPTRLAGRVFEFATDTQISNVSDAIGLPGLGPVFKANKPAGSAGNNLGWWIRDNHRYMKVKDGLSLANGFAEVLFAMAVDPNSSDRPRQQPLDMRIGNANDDATDSLNTTPDRQTGSGARAMVGDWQFFRMRFQDVSSTLGFIDLRPESAGTASYNIEWYGMILAVTAVAGTALASTYPIGYSSTSELAASGTLPDEVQTATGFGAEGTVLYHCVNDPWGVDDDYYDVHRDATVNADHAICSLVEDANNYVEVGWRNGQTLYVKSRETGEAEATQTITTQPHLQRHDDLKVAIRYSSSGVEVDVWVSGIAHNLAATTRTPDFSEPTFKCGSHADSKTIPVEAWGVSSQSRVVTDDELTTAAKGFGFSLSVGGPAIVAQYYMALQQRRRREQA